MSSHLIGTPETVLEGMIRLQERTQADELMISTRMHSYEARVRSLSLVAERWGLEAPELGRRRRRVTSVAKVRLKVKGQRSKVPREFDPERFC